MQSKAKAQKIVIKEINFSSDIDFQFELRHAINFLQEGTGIKVYLINLKRKHPNL